MLGTMTQDFKFDMINNENYSNHHLEYVIACNKDSWYYAVTTFEGSIFISKLIFGRTKK